jgi:hypothetical protein
MLKKHRIINTTVVLIVLLFSVLYTKAEGTEEDALKFFKKKEYALALPIYQELSTLHPSEAKFLYFLGVCHTETGNYDENTRKILLRASLNDVPNDIFFYVGKNYHANNEFETALEYYQQFENFGKSKQKKAFELSDLIQKTKNGENPFLLEMTNIGQTQKPDSLAESNTNQHNLLEEQTAQNTPQPESVTEPFSIPEFFTNNFIDFNITTLVTYCRVSQFKQQESLQAFINAWNKEKELQQKQGMLVELRTQYENTSTETDKNIFSNRIINMESELFALKTEAEEQYQKARDLEYRQWEDASISDRKRIGIACDSLRNQLQMLTEQKEKAMKEAEEKTEPLENDTTIQSTTDIKEPIETKQQNIDENVFNKVHIKYR